MRCQSMSAWPRPAGAGGAVEGPLTAWRVRLREPPLEVLDDLAHDRAGRLARALGDHAGEREQVADQVHVGLDGLQHLGLQQHLAQAEPLDGVALHHLHDLRREVRADVAQPAGDVRRGGAQARAALALAAVERAKRAVDPRVVAPQPDPVPSASAAQHQPPAPRLSHRRPPGSAAAAGARARRARGRGPRRRPRPRRRGRRGAPARRSGHGRSVKGSSAVAVTPPLETTIGPLVACSPTITSRLVGDVSITSAETLPMLTVLSSSPSANPRPLIVRIVPGQPVEGETAVICSPGGGSGGRIGGPMIAPRRRRRRTRVPTTAMP